MSIIGIHHIATVSADAQRSVDFYTQVLGLCLVKKTVTFDPPHFYRLYFGDETGKPGSLVSVIVKPGMKAGHPGIGGTHHFAFIVESLEAQLKWKRRLTDLGMKVIGPYNRVYFNSIYFHDPDGTILEIATRKPGFTIDEQPESLGQALRPPPLECRDGHRDEAAIAARTWREPVAGISSDMHIPGLHHITVIGSDIERTTKFFSGLLDVPLVKSTANFDDPNSPHYYYGLRLGEPGTVITYFERDPKRESPVSPGAGQTDHFSLYVRNEDDLYEWQERLRSADREVSDVINFKYYKAIQFQDPFGHTLEIATSTPGFAIDEPSSDLGTHLMLPGWLEADRELIESNLQPISLPFKGFS
jgi:glyoxalase family protein